MPTVFTRFGPALRNLGGAKVRILTHRRSLQYLGLLLALLFLSIALPYSGLRSDAVFSAMAQTLAANLAMLVGLVAFVFYSGTKNPLHVFAGAGFLGAALLDSFQVIAGLGLTAGASWGPVAPMSGSRWFLPLWLWLGVWASSDERGLARQIRGAPAAICLAGAGLSLLCLLWMRVSPGAMSGGIPGHMAAAVLYFGAVEALLRRRNWPHDAFEHGLLLSLAAGFLLNTLFLGASGEPYDALFTAAQHLKNLSYLLALGGLVISMRQSLQRAEGIARSLEEVNDTLRREAGEHRRVREQFQELAVSLEQRVEARTKESVHAQQAAERAKKEAEQARQVEQESNRQLRAEMEERLEVERALRETESRLQLALSAGRIGTWTWDIAGDNAVWDEHVYRIFGQQPGDFVPSYKDVLNLMHPDDVTAVRQTIEQAVEQGSEFDIAYRLVRPDQSIRHVVSRANAVGDGTGKTARLIGTVIDVTDHKQGEEQLRQRGKELRQLVKVLSCLYEIAHLLEQAETPLEQIYERIMELLPLCWHDPEGTFARLEAGGREYRSGGWRDTAFHQCSEIVAGGETVGRLEIGFHNLEPDQERFRQDEIKVIRMVVASLGRTVESRRATENLRRSERRYRGLFHHMMSGCALHEIIIDETGKPTDYRFLEINPAFETLTGLRAEATLGRTVREVLPGIEQEWIETYSRVALGGEAIRVEHYVPQHERYFEVTAFSPEKGRFATIFNEITERRQDEMERSAERNLLRTLIDNLPDSIYTKDTVGRFLINNKANLKELGIDTESQARGKTVFDFFPEEHARIYDADDRAVFESGRPVYDREEPYRGAGGETGCYLTTKVPLLDGEGRVTGLVGISHDITERKRAEAVLRLSQFSLDRAADSIFWIGPDARLLYANDAACASLGYPRERLLSMTIGDFDERSKDHWQEIWDDVKRVGAITMESTHVSASGERIPVEVNVNYLNFDGREYHCAFVRDITARKRADETLRESRRRMETLLSNLPGMAYRGKNDANWTLEFVSKGCETLTGLKRAELLRSGFADLIDPEDRATVWRVVQQAIRERQPFQIEYRIRTAEGRSKWVWEQGRAILIEGGEVEALEGFITDISKRRLAEEEVERKAKELSASNAQLEQFAYAASHDLQEPLRTISGYAQLLARRYRGNLDSEADEFVRFIVEGAERMHSLIRDLLAYSQVGRSSDTPEPVDLRDCAQASVDNLRAVLEENGAVVELGSLPEIRGQRSQLIQLFQNLIGNAVKYHADEPPHVQVRSERCGNEWLFTVRDNGIGIDPQYHEQVFDIFRRLHSRNEYTGTGIGLSICKKIVESHGGRIWLDSEPGRGATFRFTLPAESSPATPARQSADRIRREEQWAAPPEGR